MRGCLADEEILAFVAGQPLATDPTGASERRSAVQRHLGDCSRCRVLVARTKQAIDCERAPDAATSAPTMRNAPASVQPPRLPPIRSPGERIGRYELVRLLGHGGAGLVYEANDPKLHRRIALKLVRSNAQADDADRLLREARAMAQLSHPNVVTVHDADTYEDGVFIAMELVEGCTLSAWLAQRARPWREIVALFVEAGGGLVAAHAANLVHRDFKPENVLVGRDGRPRVTDFGLARITAMGEPERDALRQQVATEPPGALRAALLTITAGTLAGTPAYMAPEQFRGARADEATDQFNFCAALYRALFGHSPFVPTDSDETLAAVARAVLEGSVRRPSADANVPASVFAILRRGLSIQPRDRFPTMTALLEELRRTAAENSAAARPRKRRALLVTAAAACAATAGLGWLVATRPPPITHATALSSVAALANAPATPAARQAPAPAEAKPERPSSGPERAPPHRPARSRGKRVPTGAPPAPRSIGNGLLDPYAHEP